MTTQTSPKDHDIEQLRKLVRQLSAEVGQLKAEVAKLEKYQKIDYLREQLMKEEQRAEGLQKELSDIAAKETSLQSGSMRSNHNYGRTELKVSWPE